MDQAAQRMHKTALNLAKLTDESDANCDETVPLRQKRLDAQLYREIQQFLNVLRACPRTKSIHTMEKCIEELRTKIKKRLR
jgi:flagellar biosynthesis chaperone FliJ